MTVHKPQSVWTTMLLRLGLISSALAWLLLAPPVLTLGNTAKHAGHFGLVFLHVLGGTIMLFRGLANLHSGTTRRRFKYHTLLGRIYLSGGGLGAMTAILITSTSAHKSPGVLLTNTTISLLTLASACCSPLPWAIGRCATGALTRTRSGSFAAMSLRGPLCFVAS